MMPPRHKRQGYNNYNHNNYNHNNFNPNNHYYGGGAYERPYRRPVVPSNHRPTHADTAVATTTNSDSHSGGSRPSWFSFVKTNKHGHVAWGVRHPAKLH